MSRPRTDTSTPAIERQTREVLIAQLGVDEDELTRDAKLIEDLGADSLDVVKIVIALEEEFGIAIDDDAADTVFASTLGEIYAFIERAARERGRV